MTEFGDRFELCQALLQLAIALLAVGDVTDDADAAGTPVIQ